MTKIHDLIQQMWKYEQLDAMDIEDDYTNELWKSRVAVVKAIEEGLTNLL